MGDPSHSPPGGVDRGDGPGPAVRVLDRVVSRGLPERVAVARAAARPAAVPARAGRLGPRVRVAASPLDREADPDAARSPRVPHAADQRAVPGRDAVRGEGHRVPRARAARRLDARRLRRLGRDHHARLAPRSRRSPRRPSAPRGALRHQRRRARDSARARVPTPKSAAGWPMDASIDPRVSGMPAEAQASIASVGAYLVAQFPDPKRARQGVARLRHPAPPLRRRRAPQHPRARLRERAVAGRRGRVREQARRVRGLRAPDGRARQDRRTSRSRTSPATSATPSGAPRSAATRPSRRRCRATATRGTRSSSTVRGS